MLLAQTVRHQLLRQRSATWRPGGPNEFRNQLRAPKRATRTYRLLGSERIALTRRQLEQMVRGGLISPDTKVFQDGEGFATALSSRAEFRHLFADDGPPPGADSAAGRRRTPQTSPR